MDWLRADIIPIGYCVACGRRVGIEPYWTGGSPSKQHLMHATDELPGIVDVGWVRVMQGKSEYRPNCWTLPLLWQREPKMTEPV